jgi:hypothetical protein
MKFHYVIFAASIASLNSGCVGGQVIEGTVTTPLEKSFDGAYLNYFLPRGEFIAKAAYDPQSETITITPDTKTVPDLAHKETVLYRHNDMSNDVVTIELEANGLLKSISTTTTDQSKEVVKAIADVAQQFGTLRSALETSNLKISNTITADKPAGAPDKEPPPPTCSKMSVIATYDLTYGKTAGRHRPTNAITTRATPGAGDTRNPMPLESCTLTVNIVDLSPQDKSPALPRVSLDAAAYPATAFQHEDNPKGCPVNAVCFRTATGRELKIVATLDRPRVASSRAETVETIVAPDRYQGVAYFNRRAFVTNSTSITFSNGMLTKLTATDPSAALGALQLSTEILKSFTVLVKL